MFPGPDAGPGGEAAAPAPVHVVSGGFLNRRLRRILELSGHPVRLGLPPEGGTVAVWGHGKTAARGEAVAARRGASLLRIEDAFLRSLHPGRAGEPPIGLLIDGRGAHYDPAQPSGLEHLLASHPLDETPLMDRARAGIETLRAAHLTKYSACLPELALPPGTMPEPGYVLVIDQAQGDAAVRLSGGNRAMFQEMLVLAQEEHPGCPVIIKTHPESAGGHRPGYFTQADCNGRVQLLDAPVSPWSLFEGAVAVYTVSSQLGFEAIFAGHRPHVMGSPFYAGWGLTQDRADLPRRTRRLSRAQLFAGAMILYPRWYDPYRDKLCELEDVLSALAAQARAWREDRRGWVASGMRMWKRPSLQKFYGREKRVRFARSHEDGAALAERLERRHFSWAGRTPAGVQAIRAEDGFLRSRGLGAELAPPLSLVLDEIGIYYDPSKPSRLEGLIAASTSLGPHQLRRAERLIAMLTAEGLSKYNQGGAVPDLPEGPRILVAGQVEDDESVRLGAGPGASNRALLEAARAANPEAAILYKPHPDVLAGLRAGAVPEAAELADLVLGPSDPAALLERVETVWTMTSLLGFEALLRGKTVVTTGAPFYAGWGLTRDLGRIPARRAARPSLAGLVHAALIAYPRYMDPVTGLPCPVEVVAERLASGDLPAPSPLNRALSRLQGVFASAHPFWR